MESRDFRTSTERITLRLFDNDGSRITQKYEKPLGLAELPPFSMAVFPRGIRHPSDTFTTYLCVRFDRIPAVARMTSYCASVELLFQDHGNQRDTLASPPRTTVLFKPEGIIEGKPWLGEGFRVDFSVPGLVSMGVRKIDITIKITPKQSYDPRPLVVQSEPPPTSLDPSMEKLLVSGQDTDTDIIIKSKVWPMGCDGVPAHLKARGTIFKLHGKVLVQRSPVLAASITRWKPLAGPKEIVLEDFHPQAVWAAIRFAYCGEAPDPTQPLPQAAIDSGAIYVSRIGVDPDSLLEKDMPAIFWWIELIKVAQFLDMQEILPICAEGMMAIADFDTIYDHLTTLYPYFSIIPAFTDYASAVFIKNAMLVFADPRFRKVNRMALQTLITWGIPSLHEKQ